jgi:hypothetical protein
MGGQERQPVVFSEGDTIGRAIQAHDEAIQAALAANRAALDPVHRLSGNDPER